MRRLTVASLAALTAISIQPPAAEVTRQPGQRFESAEEALQTRRADLEEVVETVGEAVSQGAQRFTDLATDLGQEIAQVVEGASEEATGVTEEAAPSGREEAIAWLEAVAEGVRALMTGGYSGRLISEEELDGELFRKDLNVWFRVRPRSLHLEWSSPDEGQTLVWQQSWDRMRVNPPGLIPTVSLNPAGERALETSHRPVTTFGIDLTIDRYAELLRSTPEDAEVTFTDAGPEQRGRQTLNRFDFSFPPVPGNPVSSFTIWQDPDTLMPIHFENRRADGSVYERYRYIEFSLNPRLNDDQFED